MSTGQLRGRSKKGTVSCICFALLVLAAPPCLARPGPGELSPSHWAAATGPWRALGVYLRWATALQVTRRVM